MPENEVLTPSHVAVALAVVFVACLLTSRAQRAEGGASAVKWMAVSLLAAGLALAPTYLPLVFGEAWYLAREISTPLRVDTGQLVESAPGWLRGSFRIDLGVTFFASASTLAIVFKSLRPVARQISAAGTLPALEDESVRSRVAELAAGLGVPAPRVLLLRSVGAELDVLAWAGGLVAPALIVTDGVLHRLEKPERDAILAHELAHVARRDVWRTLLVIVSGAVFGGLTSASVSPFVSLALLFGLLHGLVKVRGHFQEPACDVLAARVIGFPQVAAALDKTHAAHRFGGRGLLSVLVHATQTHPTLEVRLAALRRVAPPAALAGFPDPEGRARGHRTWARLACGVWLAAIAAALWLGRQRDTAVLGVLGLVAVFLLPPALMLITLAPDVLANFRLGVVRIRLPWRLLLHLVGLVLFVSAVLVAIFEPRLGGPPVWGMGIGGLVALPLAFLAGRRSRRLQQGLQLAIRAHDFARGVELYAKLPPRVRRRPIPRFHFALCLARARGVRAGVAALEALARDRPRFRLARIWLARLTLDTNPDRTVTLARKLARELPKDPNPPALEAGALRRLGRHDAALRAIERAHRLDRHHRLHGLEVSVRLHAGDCRGARRALQLARTHAPGDAATLLAIADVAVETGTLEAGRAALDDAQRAHKTSPLAFLDARLDELEKRLIERHRLP